MVLSECVPLATAIARDEIQLASRARMNGMSDSPDTSVSRGLPSLLDLPASSLARGDGGVGRCSLPRRSGG